MTKTPMLLLAYDVLPHQPICGLVLGFHSRFASSGREPTHVIFERGGLAPLDFIAKLAAQKCERTGVAGGFKVSIQGR